MSQQTSASNKERRLPGKGKKKVRRLASVMRNAALTNDVANRIIHTRLSFVMFLAVLVLFVITCVATNANTISASNPEYLAITVRDRENTNIRGTVYDSNGVVLAQSYINESGTKMRDYPYPEAFSHLLGSDFGNQGIESYFHPVLVGSGSVNISKGIGNDVYSTVNAEIQQRILNATSAIDDGCIVVTDCNTGAVISMISLPTYDLTMSASEAIATYKKSEFVNKCMRQLTPGSVFKLLSACVLVDNECTPVFDDNGVAQFDDDMETIHNYADGLNPDCDITRAIERSSNVWFSTAVWQLCNRGSSFSAGTYISGLQKLGMNDVIVTQLGNLHQDHSLSHADKNELVQASYGQGGSLITPLYLNALVSAIATDGTMYTPYFVSKIVDPKGRVVEEIEPKELEYSVSEAACEAVREGMLAAADKTYELTYNGQPGNVYAKTGTAEITESRNNKWITLAFPASDPKYAVTAVDVSGLGMSSELFVVAQDVIDILSDYIVDPEVEE